VSRLRPATDSDVEMIRRWRNHPRVRRASIFTAEITPDGHREWWSRATTDPGSQVLIFEDDAPRGVVTFKDHDPVLRSAEWGFFLDVDGLEERGELLPAWMELEKAAVAYAFDELKLVSVGGRTLAWNTQVIALHRRFGFREVPARQYTTEIDGVDQLVVWTEKTR